MSTNEKKLPEGGALAGLVSKAPEPPYQDQVAALVEWSSGEHTHLALEVMAADGSWAPLVAVSLADCLAPNVRAELRQFPLFRLAWYGQVGDPNKTPQTGAPEQFSLVSSDATIRP